MVRLAIFGETVASFREMLQGVRGFAAAWFGEMVNRKFYWRCFFYEQKRILYLKYIHLRSKILGELL